MRWSERIKGFFTRRGICRVDVALLAVLLMLAAFCWSARSCIADGFRSRTAITLGYSAKQGPDGRYYVLDSGHQRLLCFDKDGAVQFFIENPSDEKSSLLYIDDFFVAEDGIYLSASQWEGMSLSREAILAYTTSGRYTATLAEADYSGVPTKKHRFFGLNTRGTTLQYAMCMENSILVGNLRLPYPNAHNAVSDVCFLGDSMYVLDKTGVISRFRDTRQDLVYSTDQDGDPSIEPYRLGTDQAGNLYFTDIRNRTVRQVDFEAKTSSITVAATDSLTVGVTQQGSFLLLDEGGLHVLTGDSQFDIPALRKSWPRLCLQTLWLLAALGAGFTGLVLLLRLGLLAAFRKKTMVQIVALWVILAVTVMAILLCSILLNSFTGSYREKLIEQVECAAYMVSNQITGEDIDAVERTGGFGGTGYQKLCETMERSFQADIAFYNQLYCNILKLSEDGGTGYAVAYLDQSIGDYYPLDQVETQALQTVYETGRAVWNEEIEDISGTYLSVKVPVFDKDGAVRGAVAVGAETYLITDTLRQTMAKVILPVVILLMVVWLISVEGMSFAKNYEMYRGNIARKEKSVLPGHLIRLLVFFVFAAYNMSATFLPVYLLRKAEIFPARMRDLAGALPITVNIFLIGVMSLFCANLVRGYGIRRILRVSALFSLGGNLLIFLFGSFPFVCAGLVLDGIGVGLVTNAVYVMLTYIKDEVNRTWGLTIYNGACLSGINFGMIVGSALAVAIGQRTVFLVVAMTWLGMLFLMGALVRQIEGMLAEDRGPEEAQKLGTSTRTFLGSKSVLGFIALIQNPYIVFGSFVFYLVPIYCDSAGYNETVCSLLIMLYSQVAVLGTEGITGYVNEKFGKYGIYLALAMNVGALLVFALTQSILGMVIALVLMGASAAFGKPVQQDYYLTMGRVKAYGEDRAMGFYNFSENIGESLGPVVFARLLATPKVTAAMGLFCGIITGCGVGHYLLCGRENET